MNCDRLSGMETWFERLSSLDSLFLELEDRTAHMHVGAVAVFEGAAPPYADLLRLVESRPHLEDAPLHARRHFGRRPGHGPDGHGAIQRTSASSFGVAPAPGTQGIRALRHLAQGADHQPVPGSPRRAAREQRRAEAAARD